MAVTIGKSNEIETEKEIQIIGGIKEDKQPVKKSAKSKKKS